MQKVIAFGATVASGLTINNEGVNRPVTKVINLLKDMQKQLENEAEADQEIYDKMACWCTTNDKEKTAAISEAEQRIADLTAAIEAGTGKSAQLTAEIGNLDKEIAANQAALDKATALRQKELAEFNEEEKDLLQTIQALKNAITVLSKHHSLLQAENTSEFMALPNIAVALKHSLRKYSNILELAPSQQKTLQQFIQAPAYAPQSGEIFGILKNMKDTFEENLSTAQKDEATAQKAYEDLKAAKEEEIKAGQDLVDKKTQERAATDEKLANDKQDLIDTRNTMEADEAFLADLKEKCKQTDQEFAQRQKTRAEEIQAVSKALEFLSSDEAHDLFTRTFNFAQVQSRESKNKRSQAAQMLMQVANKLGKPELAAIAQSVRLDAFTKVKKAIDDMVAAITQQKADEIKHRDFCIESLNQNEADTTHNTRNKEDLIAKIDDLTAQIEALTAAIKELQEQIAELQRNLKEAGENREKENLEFQKTVEDQRATIALLTKTTEVLKGFYEKSALLQQPAGPPPPAGFKSYENNAAGGGVIAMITQIIEDSKAMMAETTHDEEDAQAAYESFVQETNNSIDAKNKDITNKSETRATAEEDKANAEQDLDDTNIELEQLANAKADLHKSCDYYLKNFDVRQTAMDEEVEALRQAKAILSGMKF